MLGNIDWTTTAMCFQAIILFFGFCLTLKQLRNQNRDSQARFWIELHKEFRYYDDVYASLRPSGAWVINGLRTNEEWACIDKYLGLFEHCEMLIGKKLIDKKFFERSYKVQLSNAINNRLIWEKLEGEKALWVDLGRLCKRLGISNPIL